MHKNNCLAHEKVCRFNSVHVLQTLRYGLLAGREKIQKCLGLNMKGDVNSGFIESALPVFLLYPPSGVSIKNLENIL